MKNNCMHEACLYLELSNHTEDTVFPLHTSIVLFLMSYCESTSIKVFLVPNEDSASNLLWMKGAPTNIPINILSQQELPPVVKSCRLPALVEKDGNFCRAGLAVVLRHIVWRTCETDCNRKDVSELLGFKKTCLKACAEVSLGDCRDKTLKTLPFLARWYQSVQEVSGVKKAAVSCGIHLLNLSAPLPSSSAAVSSSCKPKNDKDETTDIYFRGGPRPTMNKLEENGISANFTSHPYPSWSLDWGNLPVAVNPIEGRLPSERALRKQQQLDNITSIVTKLAKPGDTVVDFCSGGGHVGIVLAHTLPLCQVILVENKGESLIRAKDRCDDLKLNNIWFIQANLDYFTGPFEIGVALHACGVATDMVIDHCMKAQAAFVISPCCYGFIQNTVKFSFPRSQKFRNILSYKEHMILCRFADQTAVHLPPERKIIGKKCMGLVDLDRACSAEECGYMAYVSSMVPDSCSPKNNLIVGCFQVVDSI
ncbi:glutathione S-transferase C-terminal domain-containing protein isoform X3 [Stegostoma tigrinum]|uniref:glutathione S-transferase C-terminal domain-containing protein isoform X3 n=1 Tax=Stegostoma tigrinum TaxID=3053191 RepID=UPI00286FECC1|nr:glutathione S-transferase C-terminal domain-containing protein isoform X3 [Stegostoma tigrinum]